MFLMPAVLSGVKINSVKNIAAYDNESNNWKSKMRRNIRKQG